MSDSCDEYESAIRLVFKEYQNLQKINPSHELLSLLKDVRDEGFTITREFSKRYDKENGFYSGYYHSLNRAVTKELNDIISNEKKNFEKELWEKMEEKGLVGMVRTHITHNEVSLIA